MKKILFYKINSAVANLIWLAVLGYVVYLFSLFILIAIHVIRDPGMLWTVSDFIIWGVLLTECIRNFPCKHLNVRLLSGIFALLLIWANMPVI